MKILIVSQYYYPEQFQINEIAPELARRGHEVTVLTGLPNYPEGKIYNGYENGKRRSETIDGVNVLRVKLHPRGSGSFDLLRNYLSFERNATRTVKKLKPEKEFDIVFSYQLSPVTMVKPAVKYSKKHRIPLLLYCLDIWPESMKAHVKNEHGIIYGYISKLSKKLYSACDRICVSSRPFIEYMKYENGIAEEKMYYIPQHSDASYLTMQLDAEDNGTFDFMYAGNLGAGQTLDVIVKAASEIEIKYRKSFMIHIVGDGSQRKALEELAEKLGVSDKFIFYGNQKREDMPALYKKADALLLTLRGNNFVGNTLPGKLQTYMAVGKPVLAAINGAASEVIAECKCGRCVPAGDWKGFAQLMTDYMDRPSDYALCGKNGRNYFLNNFTLNTFIDLLEKNLIETINRKK